MKQRFQTFCMAHPYFAGAMVAVEASVYGAIANYFANGVPTFTQASMTKLGTTVGISIVLGLRMWMKNNPQALAAMNTKIAAAAAANPAAGGGQ
jgi:hypothetical protein